MAYITDAQRYFHFDIFSTALLLTLRHAKMEPYRAADVKALERARYVRDVCKYEVTKAELEVARCYCIGDHRKSYKLPPARVVRDEARLKLAEAQAEVDSFFKVSSYPQQHPFESQSFGNGQAGGGQAGGRHEGGGGNGGEAGMHFGGANNTALRSSGGGAANAGAGWSHEGTRSDGGEPIKVDGYTDQQWDDLVAGEPTELAHGDWGDEEIAKLIAAMERSCGEDTASGGEAPNLHNASSQLTSQWPIGAGAQELGQVSQVRPQEFAGPPNAPAAMLHSLAFRPKAERVANKTRHKPPIRHIFAKPQPTQEYLSASHAEPKILDTPQRLLIVLDLNGTLLHRPGRSTTKFIERPQVMKFLEYLFLNHKVMVWSSARPENVAPMCAKLMDSDQLQELVAIWARDKLRIPAQAYNDRVQVYKHLTWVWSDTAIQSTHPDPKSIWSQANTILIDDSVEKAASEPQNLIRLKEFVGEEGQESNDLERVAWYLHELSWYADVSAYMRSHAFI